MIGLVEYFVLKYFLLVFGECGFLVFWYLEECRMKFIVGLFSCEDCFLLVVMLRLLFS